MMHRHPGERLAGPGLALLSAVLFGVSTPLAKTLIGSLHPWLLAGLLYLGAGLGITAVRVAQRALRRPVLEARLQRQDWPWFALVIVFGGLLGPALLMLGLAHTPASAASLLLNLESLATLAIAWLVFREHVDRRLLLGAAAILAGALILSWQGGSLAFGPGSLAIGAACLAWGIDNNLTRKLSAADPLQITQTKGLVAGSVNLLLALLSGAALPGPPIAIAAGLVGLLGYGVSLVCFILALRHLGAARTGAYFSTAPFIGAAAAVLLLGEPVTGQLLLAGALMVVGAALHLMEQHDHEHAHEALEHTHGHVHDSHHQHAHHLDAPPGEPHTHWHRHAPLIHRHPHYPDLHHRHRH